MHHLKPHSSKFFGHTLHARRHTNRPQNTTFGRMSSSTQACFWVQTKEGSGGAVQEGRERNCPLLQGCKALAGVQPAGLLCISCTPHSQSGVQQGRGRPGAAARNAAVLGARKAGPAHCKPRAAKAAVRACAIIVSGVLRRAQAACHPVPRLHRSSWGRHQRRALTYARSGARLRAGRAPTSAAPACLGFRACCHCACRHCFRAGWAAEERLLAGCVMPEGEAGPSPGSPSSRSSRSFGG